MSGNNCIPYSPTDHTWRFRILSPVETVNSQFEEYLQIVDTGIDAFDSLFRPTEIRYGVKSGGETSKATVAIPEGDEPVQALSSTPTRYVTVSNCSVG